MNHEDIQELFLEINQELEGIEEVPVNFIATKSAAKKLFVIRKIMKSVYDLDDETIDKYIFTKGMSLTFLYKHNNKLAVYFRKINI